MLLYLDVVVGSSDVNVDFYAALEINGEFLFLPLYTDDPSILYSGLLPADLNITDLLIVDIPFGHGSLPSLTSRWHAALLSLGTTELLYYTYVEFILY